MLVEQGELCSSNLIQIWSMHCSQLASHKGKEQILFNPDSLRSGDYKTQKGSLNPSERSSATVVYMKSLVCTPTGDTRRHHWNIQVKINLAGVITNTSHGQQIELRQLFYRGSIPAVNPIEPGRFLLEIKDHGSLFSYHFLSCRCGCWSRCFLGKCFSVALRLSMSILKINMLLGPVQLPEKRFQMWVCKY